MDEILLAFLRRSLPGQGVTSIIPLAGDASTRQYFRIASDSHSYILCHDPLLPLAEKNGYRFALVQSLFRSQGISVPDIHTIDSASGYLLVSDCGDLALEQAASQGGSELKDLYQLALTAMISIQKISINTNMVPFDLAFGREKLSEELFFFLKYGRDGGFLQELQPNHIRILEKEFLYLAEFLDIPKKFVLNHRDFHCRNIHIQQSQICLIDFQDARLGLPHYDLVSLLRDSYREIKFDLQQYLIHRHYDSCGELFGWDFQEYTTYYMIMALQRNLKAMGTFFYQISKNRNYRYQDALIRTLSYLHTDKENEITAKILRIIRILRKESLHGSGAT